MCLKSAQSKHGMSFPGMLLGAVVEGKDPFDVLFWGLSRAQWMLHRVENTLSTVITGCILHSKCTSLSCLAFREGMDHRTAPIDVRGSLKWC